MSQACCVTRGGGGESVSVLPPNWRATKSAREEKWWERRDRLNEPVVDRTQHIYSTLFAFSASFISPPLQKKL